MVYIILVGSQVNMFYQFCDNYETFIVSVHKNSQYLVCSTRNKSRLSSGKEVVLNPDPTVSFAHVTAIAQSQRIRSWWSSCCVLCQNIDRPIRLQEQVFAVNEPF